MPLDPVNGLLDHLTKQLGVPQQDPVSMGFADTLKRMFSSKKKDINLPSEGRTDPRIAAMDPALALQNALRKR